MSQRLPQTEDGFVRIANELYDAILAYPFTARQLKVAMAIVRKTYGYQKRTDDVSASQLAATCGLQRTHVATTLNELAALNVITKMPGLYGSIVGINKRYFDWISQEGRAKLRDSASTKSVQGCTESVHVPNQYGGCTESVQVASTKSVHTKDNLPKDNQQKILSGRPDPVHPSPAAIQAKEALEYLNEKIGSRYKPVPANLKLIMGRLSEGYSLAEVKAVVDAKCGEWAGDSKMAKYLRPATLFAPSKFSQYAGQVADTPKGEQDWWSAQGFGSRYEAENAGLTRYSKRSEVRA